MKYGMVSPMAQGENGFHILAILDAAAKDTADDQLLSATVLLDDDAGETYTLRVESQAYHDDTTEEAPAEPDREPVFLYPDQFDNRVLEDIINIPKSLLGHYVVKQDVVPEQPTA